LDTNQAKSSSKLKELENKIADLESEQRHIADIIHQSLEDMTKQGQQSEINARLSYKRAELKRKQEIRDEK
jgi:hypothetical protein